MSFFLASPSPWPPKHIACQRPGRFHVVSGGCLMHEDSVSSRRDVVISGKQCCSLRDEAVLFLLHLADSGYAPATTDSYRQRLQLLARYLGDVPPESVTSAHLADCLATIGGEEGNSGTRNCHLYAWRSFFSWLVGKGTIYGNPALLVKREKHDFTPHQPITLPEIHHLFRCIALSGRANVNRDLALLGIYAYTGIRRSEALALTFSDWLSSTRILRVRGKGNTLRMVPVIQRLHDLLQPHLEERFAGNPTGDAPFFPGRKGTRLSCRQADRIFSFWRETAKLRINLTIHSFRSGLATNLYLLTRDIFLIGKALGHANLYTTAQYIARTIDIRQPLEALFGCADIIQPATEAF